MPPLKAADASFHVGTPQASFALVSVGVNVAPVPLPPDTVSVGATLPSLA